MSKDNDFKVVDKRHSAEKAETKGEGFTAKQPPTGAPDEVDFSTFCLSLATGALINMGIAPDPITKKTQKNLEMAKQNIDILGMIRDKTRGNLSTDESKLIESLLAEVRLRFVDVSR
ncbi:MAG: DUF1844 domain-containing protein [Deltaproteobacteria bacterium]|nr:DUF1844 domain-containing protein [Deltaproteobacteria bacterium]MBI3294841.1 DUF1844 domain-containing protein [Deltaproteobacteria bacterium]